MQSASDIAHASSAYPCVVCTADTSRAFQRRGYWIRECKACCHRLLEIESGEEHVDHVYDDGYFEAGGDGYPGYLDEADIITAHGRYYGKLMQKLMRVGTVLDVGAAAGYILEGFISTGWIGVGVEPNATMVSHARGRGLDVHRSSLEAFPVERTFDLVSMVQVVDHFYDIRRAFERAALLTKPGGYWLIETWNMDSLMARIFGSSWHHYCPPSAVNWFSPESLARLAAQFGFAEIMDGCPPKFLKASHIKSQAKNRVNGGSWALRVAAPLVDLIPDKLTIPYPSFDLFWMLLEKRRG